MNKAILTIARHGALVFAAVVLASCVVVEEESRPLPPRPGPVCTQQFDPVCARRGAQTRTMGNACVARAEGFRVLYQGECRSQRPEPGPRACTREHAPVCASQRGRTQSFGNACLAEVAGFRIVHRGECRSDRPRPEQTRACTREYRPVCASRGNERRSFGNACSADVAGFRVIRDGRC